MTTPVENSVQHLSDYYLRAVEGHVYIRETLEAFFEAVEKQVERAGPRARVLELGSHAGFITESLIRKWPTLEIVVSDDDAALVAAARQRVAHENVRHDSRPLEALTASFDLVLSVARHHHLPQGYLQAVRRLMLPGGVYVLADELCPEYCSEADVQRLEDARELCIAGGYVFTSAADLNAFRHEAAVPRYAVELEDARRRALWRWYRFVVDHALERGYFDIAAAELHSAADDFITGSEAEHKFSPFILERELALSGFRQLSKRSIGPQWEPELQSMFVYEYARE